MKNLLSFVMSKTQQCVKKHAVKAMKSTAAENKKIAELKNMLTGAFKRYGYRFTRNAFDRWNINSHKKNNRQLNSDLAYQENQHKAYKDLTETMKRRNRQKVLGLLTGKS